MNEDYKQKKLLKVYNMKMELDRTYYNYGAYGNLKFWLDKIESFLWIKSYVVLLQIGDETCYHTFRFKKHPSTNDVLNKYYERYIEKKFV